MRSFWESASSPSASSSGDETEPTGKSVAPTQLLSMAIKKRRALYESKDRDFRKELLHTGMIQTLCKFLGEGRACRRNGRRASRKRKQSLSQSPNSDSLPKRYAISNADLEPMDDGEPKTVPDPMMNGGMDDGEDAVVPVVMKRPKYEQVFVPPPPPPPPEDNEPTDQEREIIKEYVFEDFMSSFVSFYTPNEYYTNDGGESVMEPIKDDLYWCCYDTETVELELEHPFFGGALAPHNDNFELLAMCES